MDPGNLPPAWDRPFRDKLAALFRWRRDVRHFTPEPVPEARLLALLEAASLAPSVGLSQPWRFVLVEDAGRRAAIRANFARSNAAALDSLLGGQAPDRAAHYARLKLEGLDQAPCQFALFALPDPAQGHGLGRATMPETTTWSAVMALHTLWLAARAEGLGLGWVSILDPAEAAATLEVPPEWRFIGYFCLGVPAEADDVPELEREGWDHRRPASEMLLRR
ncbi:5,6-dimethylbenzimidazole synthase [Pseudoroseomonas oryzae]|uniref:5,6-dimethylbenzimidazole synthase n=2 Tax=Teichococcus oryzae TaxID=1608942 RepID=A0A5B2TGT9_9PROT|nr:5,6-dimethylbenzimidazole synthase [Pseudoroseomonas oryzae]